MKTHTNDGYQLLVADLLGSGEKGKTFLSFMESWVSTAEELLDKEFGPLFEHGPVTAIRKALEPTEAQHGQIPVAEIGQMLLLLLCYWVHGEELAAGLSPIELALVGEVLDAKLTVLEMSAES